MSELLKESAAAFVILVIALVLGGGALATLVNLPFSQGAIAGGLFALAISFAILWAVLASLGR